MSNKYTVYTTLLNMGVSPALKGFPYLECAVRYMLRNEDSRVSDAYRYVANRMACSKKGVERAIATAINTAFQQRNHHQDKVFGESIKCEKGAPTNKQFIVGCALYVKKGADHEPARRSYPI